MSVRARFVIAGTLAVAVLAAFGTHAVAKPHTFPKYGVTIDIPDTGWVATHPGTVTAGTSVSDSTVMILNALNGEQTKMFVVLAIMINAEESTIDSDGKWVHECLAGMRRAGAVISDSAVIEIDGRKALKAIIKGDTSADNGPTGTAIIFIPLGRYAISLVARSMDPDPTNDPELAAMIKSFKGTVIEAEGGGIDGRDVAFNIGKWIGAALIPLGLITVVIVFIVRKRRRA